MNKEHIFNIAISFDEDSIKERAEKYLAEEINKSVGDALFTGYYSKTLSARGEDVVKEALCQLFESYKDEIIPVVIKNLTDKIARSKAMKEAVGGVLNAEKD